MRVCPRCFSLFADQELCPQDNEPTVHYTEVLVGLNLGPYIVRSMVSEGGMGVVYVGEHPTLGRRVAMKVLRPELSLRDDIVERFVQEARAVNTIGHANIVNIYDFGKTPFGTFYIVMEYLEGRTLRALLDSAGPQPLERVRFVADGVGTALAAAHNKGFIHRDVKPENIMVGQRSGSDYVKLLDFGIAKLLTTGNTTATSSAMGTPQYMSPEQLDDARLDHRSDIFSLGCVLYELLTGQVPFPGGSQAGVRQAQLTRQPPPPSICRRDIHISETIDQAVLAAIALEPDQRPQTMEAFLESFRRGYDATLREQHAKPRRQTKTPTWKIFAVSGAFAILLGTIVALLILLLNKDDKVATPGGARQDLGLHADKGAPARPAALSLSAAKAIARKKIDAAVKAGDPRVARGAAVVAAEALRPALLAALEQPALKVKAAYALGALKTLDPESRAALRKVLAGPAGFAAIAATSTLARHGDAGALAKLRLQRRLAKKQLQADTALFELVQVDKSAKLAKQALTRARRVLSSTLKARGLGPLARRGHEGARKLLLSMLDGGSDSARLHAAEALAGTLSRARRERALKRAEASPNGRLRAWATGLLARRGDAKSAENLLEYLSSMDAQARRRSALELGRLARLGKLSEEQRGRAQKLLIAALGDESAETALAAAVALMAW